MTNVTARLSGGPQDGGWVKTDPNRPYTIYLPVISTEDIIPWLDHVTKEYGHRYQWNGTIYVYVGKRFPLR
jgi:hypothetical protein